MVRFILGWFGYVKIPLAVVRLSMEQEVFLRTMLECSPYPVEKKYLFKYLEGQKVLTLFLRSGKLLSHCERSERG